MLQGMPSLLWASSFLHSEPCLVTRGREEAADHVLLLPNQVYSVSPLLTEIVVAGAEPVRLSLAT